jgi:hypothetical protein
VSFLLYIFLHSLAARFQQFNVHTLFISTHHSLPHAHTFRPTKKLLKRQSHAQFPHLTRPHLPPTHPSPDPSSSSRPPFGSATATVPTIFPFHLLSGVTDPPSLTRNSAPVRLAHAGTPCAPLPTHQPSLPHSNSACLPSAQTDRVAELSERTQALAGPGPARRQRRTAPHRLQFPFASATRRKQSYDYFWDGEGSLRLGGAH